MWCSIMEVLRRRVGRLPGRGAGGLLAGVLLAGLTAVPAVAGIKVVASINDLASIAAEVGGELVEVAAIARPGADVHRVEVLPSYMVRVSRAQLYLKVGLGLDQWADPIIDGSRNGKLVIVDCSQGIAPLDKPAGKVDASMGDVHPEGNPHYWLDPRNGAIAALTIAEALSKIDPTHAADYRARADALGGRATAAYDEARGRLQPVSNRAIFTYHTSWSYFLHAFDLELAGTVEPFPGIPPTGKHLQELVEIGRARKVPLLLEEPYFSAEAGEFLARETGLRVERVSASCDEPSAGSWLAHLRAVVDRIGGTAR
jgi:ABC-type Zn uptake system ZnuABC Zn-binding protein ZnuA